MKTKEEWKVKLIIQLTKEQADIIWRAISVGINNYPTYIRFRQISILNKFMKELAEFVEK